MWEAVRKIFRQDDATVETGRVNAEPGVAASGLGVSADDVATPAQPSSPMMARTESTAMPDHTEAQPTAMPDDHTEAQPGPAAPLSDSVRISPPDHASQGLAAEDSAPAPVAGQAEAEAEIPVTPPLTSPPPTSSGLAEPPTPLLSQEQNDRASLETPDAVVVTAPTLESPVADATPPVASVPTSGMTKISSPITPAVSDSGEPDEQSEQAPMLPDGADSAPVASSTPLVGEARETTSVGEARETTSVGEARETTSVGEARETTSVDAGSPADTDTETAALVSSVEAKRAGDALEDSGAEAAVMEPVTEAVPARQPVAFAPGAIVAGRYTIVENTDQSDGARTYRATDSRSYERCWSCGSAQNGPGNRFCQNCGAPIQNHPVVLLQTATATDLPDEIEQDGVYLHVQPERRLFGAEGVGVEVGAHSAEGPHHPNEDSYWYTTRALCANSGRHGATVALLADGMGGYAPGSGLISSRIVTTAGAAIAAALDARGEDVALASDDAEAIVRAGIAAANAVVLDEIARSGDMGATLIAVVVQGDTAYLANVGDSRAYYIDPHGQAVRITRDQSLVAQELGQGGLSDDDIYTAPGNNIILHAVGEAGVETAADWYTQPLEPGSLLLLCSDGYWKTMRGAPFSDDSLHGIETLNGVARRMVDDALARGSDDNTTVLLIAIS